MTWDPNYSRAPHKPGTKTLLWKAFNLIKPAELLDKLSDGVGTFALNLDKGVLVAKKNVYGWCISAHKQAVVSAFNQKKPLIMYLDSGMKFYDFDPKEILDNNEENMRGDAIMLNWNINLGRRREVLFNVR